MVRKCQQETKWSAREELGVHTEVEGQARKPLISRLIFLKVQNHHKQRVHQYNTTLS